MKFLPCLLLAFLLFCLSGCGTGGQPAGTETGSRPATTALPPSTTKPVVTMNVRDAFIAIAARFSVTPILDPNAPDIPDHPDWEVQEHNRIFMTSDYEGEYWKFGKENVILFQQEDYWFRILKTDPAEAEKRQSNFVDGGVAYSYIGEYGDVNDPSTYWVAPVYVNKADPTLMLYATKPFGELGDFFENLK